MERIFPFRYSWTSHSWRVTERPVAGISPPGDLSVPVCVPLPVNWRTTRSPWATVLSIDTRPSGKPSAHMRENSIAPSLPRKRVSEPTRTISPSSAISSANWSNSRTFQCSYSLREMLALSAILAPPGARGPRRDHSTQDYTPGDVARHRPQESLNTQAIADPARLLET